MMILTGCFGAPIADSDTSKDRLSRRGYTVTEYTGGSTNKGAWMLELSGLTYDYLSINPIGKPFGIDIKKAIIAVNQQTMIPNGGAIETKLTQLYIIYCEDEENASRVCEKINTGKIRYEIVAYQGSIAYYGDKYAYKAATRDMMIFRDRQGLHFN